MMQMIAEVGDAVLQVLLLVRFHFRGWDLLQFLHNPLRRMMLVLEIYDSVHQATAYVAFRACKSPQQRASGTD
jgi:hypothetical protein